MMRSGLFLLALWISCLAFADIGAGGISGRWLQLDDDDGLPSSVIEIRRVGNLLTGRIVELYLPPGMAPPLCTACNGKLHGQAILGLQVLEVRDAGRDRWEGEILDPENGKTYQSKLELRDSKTLDVRGYIGVPLFGRTQRWRRMSD